MKKIYFTMLALLSALLSALLISCSTAGPLETPAPKTDTTTSAVTTATQTTKEIVPTVPVTTATETTAKPPVVTTATPETSAEKPSKVTLPLEFEAENASLFLNGSNPGYDSEANTFACYFNDMFDFWFTASDTCTLKITSENIDESIPASLDFTVNNGNISEEGIFCGIGIKTDYVFTVGKTYAINVTIETGKYFYTFSFDFTKSAD